MLVASLSVRDQTLQKSQIIGTFLFQPHPPKGVVQVEDSPVLPRAGGEADSINREVHNLAKERILPLEQRGALSLQFSTDDLDLGHLLENLRDRVRETLTPLAEIWSGKLRLVTGSEK